MGYLYLTVDHSMGYHSRPTHQQSKARFRQCHACAYQWNWSGNTSCHACAGQLAVALDAPAALPRSSQPWVEKRSWKQHFWSSGDRKTKAGAKWPPASAGHTAPKEVVPPDLQAALHQHMAALPEDLRKLVAKLPVDSAEDEPQPSAPLWKEDLSISRKLGKKRQALEKATERIGSLREAIAEMLDEVVDQHDKSKQLEEDIQALEKQRASPAPAAKAQTTSGGTQDKSIPADLQASEEWGILAKLDTIKASMEALLAAAAAREPAPLSEDKEGDNMDASFDDKSDVGPDSQLDPRKSEAKRLLDDLFEELGSSEGLDRKKSKLMGALGLKEQSQGSQGGSATPRASQENIRGRSRSPSKQKG